MKKIFMLLLAISSTLLSDQIDDWNLKFSEGLVYLSEGDWESSISKFDECLDTKKEKDFFYYDTLLQKSYALKGLQKHQEALDLCDQVISESKSAKLIENAYNLKIILDFEFRSPREQLEDLKKSLVEKEKNKSESLGQKSVIGVLQDSKTSSLEKLKCYLIHNRLTYGKDDVQMISQDHYVYKVLCFCGCPESKSKIKNYCDQCGQKLEPIPDDFDFQEYLKAIFQETGMDYEEYLKEIKNSYGKKGGRLSSIFFLAYAKHDLSALDHPSKTACETGCWAARVAACGWCSNKFKNEPFKQAACVDFTVNLLSKCYDCCKTKDDFIQCTGPFGKVGKYLYDAWSESGNALSCDWGCTRCGNFNQNSWPPFVCRGCGKFKNG